MTTYLHIVFSQLCLQLLNRRHRTLHFFRIEQCIFENVFVVWLSDASESKIVWIFGQFLHQITIHIG